MPLFNSQKVFDGDKAVRLMSVKANGGSIAVEAMHDPATSTFVTAAEITEDGVYEVNFDVLAVRITPTGGATYSLQVRA